ATTEVPAPAGGLLRILVPEGSTVAIGAVVGRLEPAPEEKKSPAPASPKTEKTASVSHQPLPDKDRVSTAKTTAEGSRPVPPAADSHHPVLLSPAAKHLALEAAVDPSQLHGTGPGGRVLKE